VVLVNQTSSTVLVTIEKFRQIIVYVSTLEGPFAPFEDLADLSISLPPRSTKASTFVRNS
jgi:hypothetical protein